LNLDGWEMQNPKKAINPKNPNPKKSMKPKTKIRKFGFLNSKFS
jgi:hypothetical protein